LLAPEISEYYSSYGIMTDPGQHRELLEALPDDVGSLCEIIHGLVIHDGWIAHYGVELREGWLSELRLKRVEKSISRILELNPSPLHVPRPPAERLIGCCRDFTVLLCSILQTKGIPARARVGFDAYLGLDAPTFGDHWVCEYWDEVEDRWVLVDAQIDDLQRQRWGIDFDVLDVPRERFLLGGRAWEMCRSEGYDPTRFGLKDARGLWFVRGNLVRDLAALNKVETVPFLVGRPWDGWEIITKEDSALSAGELELLDRVAQLTQGVGDDTVELRRICGDTPLFWPPKERL